MDPEVDAIIMEISKLYLHLPKGCRGKRHRPAPIMGMDMGMGGLI